MNLAELNLNLLVALDALLKERNVTRAGKRIGLSQPATSAALNRLRAFFKDDLLVRMGHEYRLTSLAEDLIHPVEEILNLIDETVNSYVEFNPVTAKRVFRIAASEVATHLILQPFVQKVVSEAPGISIAIRSLTAHATVAAIEAGEIDLGIWRESMVPSLEATALFRDRWVCAVWRERTDVGSSLTLDEFNSLPRIGRDWSAQDWQGLTVQRDLEPDSSGPTRIAHDMGSQHLFLVRGTSFVAMTPERYGLRMAGAADIRLADPPFEIPYAEALYWHRRKAADPANCWLRAALLEIAANLRPEGAAVG